MANPHVTGRDSSRDTVSHREKIYLPPRYLNDNCVWLLSLSMALSFPSFGRVYIVSLLSQRYFLLPKLTIVSRSFPSAWLVRSPLSAAFTYRFNPQLTFESRTDCAFFQPAP